MPVHLTGRQHAVLPVQQLHRAGAAPLARSCTQGAVQGMLQVEGSLDLWIVKFTAGGNFKVTDAAGGAWSCNVPGMQCEDFCVMKTGAWPPRC